MSDKSSMKKFVHDLSNKIMILEGYLATGHDQPEHLLKDILVKCEISAGGASEILMKMRELLETSDSLSALLYCSRVNEQNDLKEVMACHEHIEQCSQKNNAIHNITGYLLYIDGYFIQYMEGNSEKVKDLYSNICLDPRHKLISLLSHTSITKRAFQSWQKMFSLNRQELTELPVALEAILHNKHRLLSRDESLGLVNFVEMLTQQRSHTTEKIGVINNAY